MSKVRLVVLLALVACGLALASAHARADDAAMLARGHYLVSIMGCNDCHTPGYFLGKPDMARFLGGSDVGFAIPGLGVFVPPNLTPDQATGLGSWTAEQIVTAFTTGVRPDGRELAPIMPWREMAGLTPDDAAAIAAYLQSLPPVDHQVPGPFGPNDQVSGVFVMTIVPGEVFNGLPKPAE